MTIGIKADLILGMGNSKHGEVLAKTACDGVATIWLHRLPTKDDSKI